jgi:hypothetical protein
MGQQGQRSVCHAYAYFGDPLGVAYLPPLSRAQHGFRILLGDRASGSDAKHHQAHAEPE